MKKTVSIMVLISVIVFILLTPIHAAVEWDLLKTFKIEVMPLDMAISKYGRWIFVLTEQAEILIYSSDGKLNGKIPVGNFIDGIKPGHSENILLLSSRKDKTVQTVGFDFIQDINVAGSPFRGPSDAPVVIDVFSDFQCSACAGISTLLEQVLDAYPKKVKLVYKNYPLANNKVSQKAAAAALAAEKQGLFWEFRDLLFENCLELSDQKIKEISELLGLDWEKLSKDMEDPEVISIITRDQSEGDRARLSQIPTIFINGRHLKQLNLQGFKSLIEYELQKLDKRAVVGSPRKTLR